MNKQLYTDWLDALLILRRVIEPQDVRSTIAAVGTNIHYDGRQAVAVAPQYSIVSEVNGLYIAAHYENAAKIERVEVLTYAAAGVWFSQRWPGDPFQAPREAFQQLCRRAGCWFKNTAEIRERWRLVDFFSPAHLLPSAVFEDRPPCRLCRQPVATGAGAWRAVKDQETARLAFRAFTVLPGDIREIDGKICSYHPDIHEECERYAHRVMLPARQLQMEKEKAIGGHLSGAQGDA